MGIKYGLKQSPVFKETGDVYETAPFNEKRGSYIHKGVDVVRNIGYNTTCHIVAIADGVIKAVKNSVVGVDHSQAEGNYVDVSHGGGMVSRYFHLKYDSIPDKIRVGASVKKGDILGYMGNTGDSYGAHLHFQLEKNGKPIDGTPYLKGEKRIVYFENVETRDNEKELSFFLKDVDISEKEYIQSYPNNAILNQKNEPLCVSYSAAAACMSKVYELTNKRVILSPESLQGYCGAPGGKTMWYFAEYLNRWGILPKSVFDYKGDNPELREYLVKLCEDMADVDEIASKIHCNGWSSLRFVEDVKKALKQNFRVVASYNTTKNFGKVNGGIEPLVASGAKGKHAVHIKGWTTIDGEEYFVIVNSYGEKNGDNGVVYIPVKRGFNEALLLDITTNIKPKCKKIELYIGKNACIVDGNTVNIDAYPYIKNGRTYLPLRFVAESLGASVEWDDNAKTAYIVSEEAEISVTPNSNVIVIDGKKHHIDVAPEIVNDRTMIPIRHIAEALNCKVEWDEIKQKVTIISL